MTTKTKIIISLTSLTVAFAVGRYSARQQVANQTQVNHEVTKNETHTHKVTTIRHCRHGGETTTIVEDSSGESVGSSTSNQKSPVVLPSKSKTLNISALAAIDFHTGLPTYGASVSKEVLGPVTVGAFGLSNGTVGVSIGLDF